MTANYKQLLKVFESHNERIRAYFDHLPALINQPLPYEISIAYMFSRVEKAHRRTLYCGIVKKYSANSQLTDEITRNLFLKREEFLDLFKAIFGQQIPENIVKIIKSAEKIRDKGVHGKDPTDPEMRNAIKEILEYSNDYNVFVKGIAGFEPFGDLRGFKGRAENMDKDTTKLILKGLGFKI